MRTVRTRAAIPATAIALATLVGGGLLTACSSEPAAQPTTSQLGASAPPPPPSSTLAVVPDTATQPSSETSAEEPLSGPVQLDVLVGTDSGPSRIEFIRVGADVTLNITNPAAADEYHIHGIELEQSVAAGTMATFNFAVSSTGTFEVESHQTGAVLIVLQVV